MTRIISIFIFITVVFNLFTSTAFALVAPGYKFHAKNPGYPCGDAPITDYFAGTETEMTYTAPAGGKVTGVCFFTTKSLHNGPVKEDKTFFYGCFTVKGIGTQSVTVVRNNVSSNCSGNLSHMDVYGTGLTKPVIKSPIPTPSPTPSPSPSPTPSPSPEPSPTTAPSEVTIQEEQPEAWWKQIPTNIYTWLKGWFQ